jgi:hypothetical protein
MQSGREGEAMKTKRKPRKRSIRNQPWNALTFGPTSFGTWGITWPVEDLDTRHTMWESVQSHELASHLREHLAALIVIAREVNGQVESILREHLEKGGAK